MVTPEEYRAFWGQDNLVRAKPEALRAISLPAETKEFLLHIGLPRQADLMLSFQLDFDELPQVASSGVYKIGTDGYIDICIEAAQNACVLAIDPRAQLPTRFVNSGVLQLAECLTIYKKSKIKFLAENLGEDEAQHFVQQLARELSKADPPALAGVENMWAVVIEQMEDGLL